MDAVRGTLVELAGLLGMPVVRLAAALPEPWLRTSMQAATGRRHGLSATAFRSQYKTLKGARRHGLPASAGAAASAEQCAPARDQERRDTSLMKVVTLGLSRGSQVMVCAAAEATQVELAAAQPAETAQLQQRERLDGWSELPFHTDNEAEHGVDAGHAHAVHTDAALHSKEAQNPVDGWGTPPFNTGFATASSFVDGADAPDVQEMVSTALAHAVMLGYCICSAEEVAAQQVQYLARLAASGIDTDGSRFLHLFTVCKELIIPGVLGAGQNWLRNARLARVVLLSNPFGFWDADSGVAASLLAHTYPLEAPSKHGLQLLLAYVQSVVSAAVSAVIGGASLSSTASAADSVFQSRMRAYSGKKRSARSLAEAAEDDPLLFTEAAIEETLPLQLAEAFVESSGTALRAWTTALVAELLLTLQEGWRVCVDPRADDDAPVTLVDAALHWLAATLDGSPTELLPAVRAAARDQVVLWATLHDEMITRSRNAHVPTRLHKHVLEQRAAGAVFNAALTQHATARLFVAEIVFGGRPHQQFAVIVTLLIVALAPSIWLYYSRAMQCCLAVRTALGCSADAFTPCRGYSRSCAELASTYYRFAYAAMHGADSEPIALPAPGLQCQAFPDPAFPLHTLVAGFISFACCVPAAWVLQACFSLSMATDDAQLHGRSRLMRWSLGKRLLLGPAPWEHRPGVAHRMRTRAASTWCATLAEQLTMRAGDALGALARRAGVRPHPAATLPLRIAMPLLPVDERVDAYARSLELRVAASHHDRVTTHLKRAGFVLLALAWGICLWVIIIYGTLIYKLLGPDAEATFTRSWGIGIGLDQAKQARAIISVSLQTVAALLILEALYLSPNMLWLESMADEASVAATLLRSGAVGLAARVRSYVRFNKAVI